MNIEEADWRQAIRDTGDYLVDFHVADNNRMPPGQGAIDWDALVQELAGIGYEEYLTVEFVVPVVADEYRAAGVRLDIASNEESQ
jgi:D-psicose/D-tagatose/L-ribulose 3-epimerase